jgi:phosphatidylglycerophosphate synthase
MTAIETVGTNSARLWGLTAERRLERIAAAQGLGAPAGEARILVNLGFVFEPAWLRWVAERPGHVLTRGGVPALAHCPDEPACAEVRQAIVEERLPEPAAGLVVVAQETSAPIHNDQLRKREVPFVERLTPASAATVERADYYASYKGVTDLLTRYLWRELALHLTRLAAAFGLSPNMVTTIGAAFCVAAGFAFYEGRYWTGMAAALVFMVLDTVDGKLARCTITSSKLGDVLDHGIDLIHPPIWWWAWGMGLYAYGRPLDWDLFLLVMAAIIAGYVVQRAIEGAFILWFGMHIHVWQKLDSRFRLITARRNPNMVILFVALLLGYPDSGLVAVAVWTAVSCLFHGVRLVQARLAQGRGRIASWLET